MSLAVASATCVVWLAGAAVRGQAGQLAIDFVSWVPLLGVPWALGRTLRVRSRLRLRAHQEEERRRAYGQRLEVARDVHDVVGHSLAVITMQSGIALHVMDRRPEQARVALYGAPVEPALQQTSAEVDLGFVPLLALHTRQAFYADPIYGGNRNRVGREVIGLLGDLNRQDGLTIIMVTHNLDLVSATDRVVRLVAGRVEQPEANPFVPGVSQTLAAGAHG